MTRTTIKDVARAAQVSETTVSLAFRKDSRISERTRCKVLQAAQKLQYTPNLVARNLRQGRNSALGFIVNDVANPFYGVMLREAEQSALERGFCMVFGSSNWDPDKERVLITQMLEMRVPGIVICFCETRPENYALIQNARVPCIAVDSYPDWYDGPYVANDFEAAAELTAEHFVGIGCHHPLLLTAEPKRRSFSAFCKIEKYFAQSLARRGVALDREQIVPAGLDITSGRNAMRRALAKQRPVDSVWCINDLCAAGAVEALTEKGLRPGRDVAVIGIDDIEMSSFSGLSLTSLHQPYEDIARRAAYAMADAVENHGHLTLRAELPPELRVRATTSRDNTTERKNTQ